MFAARLPAAPTLTTSAVLTARLAPLTAGANLGMCCPTRERCRRGRQVDC